MNKYYSLEEWNICLHHRIYIIVLITLRKPSQEQLQGEKAYLEFTVWEYVHISNIIQTEQIMKQYFLKEVMKLKVSKSVGI